MVLALLASACRDGTLDARPMDVRVLIVDDQGMVRAGLERLIGAVEDLEVVATAAGGREGEAVPSRTD